MNDSATRRPLTLHLYPNGQVPEATTTEIRALGDARAWLSLGGGVDLHVALPTASRAEARWVVDKLVRDQASMSKLVPGRVEAADGVDDDLVQTLALDLWNRLGAVEVNRPAIQERVVEIARAEDGYRAWVDEDPSLRTSVAIARDVENWAATRDRVSVEVFDETALAEQGMRLILAVGQGSQASPSRLVLAHYTPEGGQSEAPMMLLGKGITFDTGGINVKPYEAFVPMMKNDMAGAALAFHLFRALVEAGHSRPLVLALPTCENAVGAASMRPGALVKSHRGHTVRIDHTDAEGRLVLADALSYASARFEPSRTLCFATLTTAALIAYGPYATPVHFADPELEAGLRTASEATGEDLHFFPERLWHFEANRDQEADLRNTARLPGNASRGAGSRNAAHFLKHFTDQPLVHFDIFGSTWNWAGDAPGAGYGATGAPLRTLLRALS